jgi:tRNA modification GTPase
MGTVFDGNEELDSVLVSLFRAPRSYTGEDAAEISCHASLYIASRILALLVDAGARMAGPGEFTRRAFANGKMDLAQAEAVADLVAASSQAAQRVAMTQLKGGYSSELRALREQLVEMASLLELELDFSEEDVEFASRGRLASLLDRTLSEVESLASSFQAGNAIKNGVPVAIVGAVNTGKSTLLNALVGDERAIVSDIAGTTRDTVEEQVLIDGVCFRFIDTAGLRRTSGVVERMGIERSLESVSKASVVLVVLDGSAPLPALRDIFAQISAKVDAARQTLIVIRNKKDICGGSWILSPAAVAADLGVERVFDMSARTGEGLDVLRSELAAGWKEALSSHEDIMVTSLRHYEALCRAASALREVGSGLSSGLPTDLIAQSLRLSIYELNTIFGEVTTDELLGEIFGRFCIGK